METNNGEEGWVLGKGRKGHWDWDAMGGGWEVYNFF